MLAKVNVLQIVGVDKYITQLFQYISFVVISVESQNKKPTSYTCSKLTLTVLPFRNLCPNNEYQFFVDGFGEELTYIFSNFQDITVIAHYSTRKYYVASTYIRVIGSELETHHLVTGSLRCSSREIRISVGLAETMNSTQIWNKWYNYALKIL